MDSSYILLQWNEIISQFTANLFAEKKTEKRVAQICRINSSKYKTNIAYPFNFHRPDQIRTDLIWNAGFAVILDTLWMLLFLTK